jgi:hypothetical protein
VTLAFRRRSVDRGVEPNGLPRRSPFKPSRRVSLRKRYAVSDDDGWAFILRHVQVR